MISGIGRRLSSSCLHDDTHPLHLGGCLLHKLPSFATSAAHHVGMLGLQRSCRALSATSLRVRPLPPPSRQKTNVFGLGSWHLEDLPTRVEAFSPSGSVNACADGEVSFRAAFRPSDLPGVSTSAAPLTQHEFGDGRLTGDRVVAREQGR